MNTETLFYESIDKLDFDANVLEVTKHQDKFHVILDKTAFYPESGGMDSDIGYLDDIKVEKVIKKDGIIIHITNQKPNNSTVVGKVDKDIRFTNIQIHDAQHLITGLFEKEYNLVTTSHHVHGDYCDIVVEGMEVTQDIINDIEAKANMLIIKNKRIDIFLLPKSQLSDYNITDNPKYSDPVRIINIEEVNDYNACGCLHFDNLSYIQAIKCLGFEKNGKQCKIMFTAGLRMLNYFETINNIFKDLKVLIKANEEKIIPNTQALIDKNTLLTRELNEIKNEYYTIKLEELFKDSNDGIIIHTSNTQSFSDLKAMANLIINYDKPIVALLQTKKDDNYQFILVKQKENDYSLENLFSTLKASLEINGGGKGLTINGQSKIDLSKEISKYM